MQNNISAEKRELDILLEKGVSFEIERKYQRRAPGFLGRFRKPESVTEKVKYTVQEPTLAVLDAIAAEQIELVIDEAVMRSESALNAAKKLTSQHAKRMARIVAIAVLGEDYFTVEQRGAAVKYRRNEAELERLTQEIFAGIKPSKLLQLTLMVNTISNLGDFTNSIRLMSAARTTMPNRVEAEHAG